MADRIRIIPHYPEGIPDCESFEVWFPDGRESQWFYWDNNPGRASIIRKMDREEDREAARALREPSAISWSTPAHYATAAAGSAKRIPINLGRDHTTAPVARPARHAHTATAPKTNRCGCRKDVNRTEGLTERTSDRQWRRRATPPI